MKKKFIYPALVVKEAKSLRKLTTKEEKQNLDLEIEPENTFRCVYGRLTGDCHSERAIDLIKSSCSRVYNPSNEEENENSMNNARLNGSPKKLSRYHIDGWTINFWSPIEVFIYKYRNDYSKIDRLAKFIQGKVKTL